MRILVTGAGGFIGKHLLPLLRCHELLLIGRATRRVDLPNANYVQADLADVRQWATAVRTFSPEACIHLAWTGLPDYSLSRCLENFNSSVGLIHFLRGIECPKIFVAGTCWEYGDLRGQVRETDSPQAMNLFASFKAALRLVAEGLTGSAKTDLIWGRLFFVYGPGQRETSLIPSCYTAFKNGQGFTVNNPKSVCDFIHVADVARAIQTLIESPGVSGIFNIGSGTPRETGEVCRLVSEFFKATSVSRAGGTCVTEARGVWADLSLIKARTGWTPELSLEAGIQKTLDVWKETDACS